MELEQRQSLSLSDKIVLSQKRIRDWYNYWGGDVYVSFSGGKDSTVLLDVVRKTSGVDDVPAVYCDTGLEWPEVREFALEKADIILRPSMSFKKVLEKYGYPIISKEQASYIREYRHTNSEKLKDLRWNGKSFSISKKWRYLVDAPFEVSEKCCDIMKKRPFKKYESEWGLHPYLGNMAAESNLRTQQYKKYGCNAFAAKRPKSTPLGFWTENDILEYITTNNLDYAKIYGDIIKDENGNYKTTGVERTGCMFCGFGCHLEKEPNRFQKMKQTHPKQWDYCINNLGLKEVLDYINVPYE
jgi:3'-phosphoadenosine 5'-phosphosulfate sulfotransferase (PAPS reductase)/FAD synthetase